MPLTSSTTPVKPASFGTISEGTSRPEDLLTAFADELEDRLESQSARFKRSEYRRLIKAARTVTAYAADGFGSGLIGELLIGELKEALETFAPPYGYFGTLGGDGACFGYWIDFNILYGDSFDGVRVTDLAEVPRDYRGDILLVNDHGNVSLYRATSRSMRRGRGRFREIWAIV